MITIEGLNGIKATVLAYSINKMGEKLVTWEIEYPRLILAEFNTHRELSRNSYSSRAVPFLKMLEQLTGEPVRFGANQPGMQDNGEDFDANVTLTRDTMYQDNPILFTKQPKAFKPRSAWSIAKDMAIDIARGFFEAGYHKQVYNRLTEAFQMQKTVVSATQTDNFFWLRDDDAADPTIRELARVMREAQEQTVPELLQPGEWHLPYVDWERDDAGDMYHYIMEDDVQMILTIDQAIKVSCARCAAVSYRNEGYGLEKSLDIYDKLVGSDKKHASAFEHCATPMKEETVAFGGTGTVNIPWQVETWEPGISHMDRNMNLWSGNFKGFVQYRKLIPGECYNAG